MKAIDRGKERDSVNVIELKFKWQTFIAHVCFQTTSIVSNQIDPSFVAVHRIVHHVFVKSILTTCIYLIELQHLCHTVDFITQKHNSKFMLRLFFFFSQI